MFGTLGTLELACIALVAVLYLILVAFPTGRICGRLGYSPYLGLLAVVPIANVALLLFVAFSNWPALSTDDTSGKR